MTGSSRTMPSVSHADLVTHLRDNALRTDGPFTLRSGQVSDWYLDARETTFDGEGARIAGIAVLDAMDPAAEAVGGMTMGADPIAVATALTAALSGRAVKAFSVRKEEKDHGTGGRVVGPVRPGMRVAMVDDTVTTGGALFESIDVVIGSGLEVIQAMSLVDRSQGSVAAEMGRRGIPYLALVTSEDLGVGP